MPQKYLTSNYDLSSQGCVRFQFSPLSTNQAAALMRGVCVCVCVDQSGAIIPVRGVWLLTNQTPAFIKSEFHLKPVNICSGVKMWLWFCEISLVPFHYRVRQVLHRSRDPPPPPPPPQIKPYSLKTLYNLKCAFSTLQHRTKPWWQTEIQMFPADAWWSLRPWGSRVDGRFQLPPRPLSENVKLWFRASLFLLRPTGPHSLNLF